MVTSEQFINGLVAYMDNEVMPHLSTAAKWGLGAGVVLASRRSQEVVQKLTSNELMKTLGVVSADGLIDVDALADALAQSARRYGNLTVTLPAGLGILTFNESDVMKARQYMGGSNDQGRS